MAGKPGRSGRKKGVPQHNGAMIARLPLGELPKTMRRQLISARKYRRELEGMVAQKNDGSVNATAAHLINEAVTAETHATVCRWLLRTRLDKMTVSDIAKCSSEIMKARAARNRAVERLGLDIKPEPKTLKDYIEGNGT
jgi:hypothetical protein